MVHTVLEYVLILLSLAVIVVMLMHRLRLSPIIGYLLVGIVIGPHAFGILALDDTGHLLGEIGVVFLLFTIGLEFSVHRFRSMKKELFVLGGGQVLVGTVSGGVIAWSLGINWQGALIMGGALALSSTALVMKQLTEQLELKTEYGTAALGILLFQDIAAIPFLVLIPILVSDGEQSLFFTLMLSLLKGGIALAVIILFGKFVLRRIFHAVSASEELFTLTVLLISLTAAWLSHLAELSLALGAFLAGIMLSETEYRHQIESEIRPFRDILLGFFFITVGMQLDLAALATVWPWTLLLVAGLVLGKGLVIFLLMRLTGYSFNVGTRTGQILAQGGEFSLALLALAVFVGLINIEDSQPILAAIILSMMIAPMLIRHNDMLVSRFTKKKSPKKDQERLQSLSNSSAHLEGHVILCGYGIVGQSIANVLLEQEIPFIALDSNAKIVKSAWENDEPVFFGNATRVDMLKAAGISRAKVAVVCVDKKEDAVNILKRIRSITTDVPILVRARDDVTRKKLLELGATQVVTETMETALVLSAQLLLAMGGEEKAVLKEFNRQRSIFYE